MSVLEIDSTLVSKLKAAIVDVFKAETDGITTETIYRAVRWVQTEIDSRGFNLSYYLTADWHGTYYMLYEATFWMLAEFLSNIGLLFYRPGEVSEEQLGKLRLRYESSQARIFSLRELPINISAERLISHETYRMLAFACIDKFYLDYKRGNIRKYNAIMQSSTDPNSSHLWV